MSQLVQFDNQYILFDGAYLTGESCAQLFASDSAIASVNTQGRGEARFFRCGEYAVVGKHYLRGGLLARFIQDRYFGCNAEATRAFKEWRLLSILRGKGLPVPAPVAARVVIKRCFYQADLVTLQISNARTLAEYLSESSLGHDAWRAIGACIKRFHQYGVYHADLNATNILINQQQELFVLDFDKGAIKSGELWKVDNLERLRRSLQKFKQKKLVLHFNDDDWRQLIQAYMNS